MKEEIYLYVNSSTYRCLNKIISIFPFAKGVIDTCGAPLAANISPQGLGGNWFMKKPEAENLVAL